MDPNLFYIDWEQLLQILAAVIILSFVVERALALLFENKLYVRYLGDLAIKEAIAFGLAFFICWQWHFDLLAVLLRGQDMSIGGEAITAAVIAGGSKASIKLFRDVLGVRSQSAAAAASTQAPRG